jgi:hypothetical protein
MSPIVVLGLDLSLSAAGMVALPSTWDGDWSRVARHWVGESVPKDAPESRRIGRLHRISSEILAFASRHGCTTAAVEGYAFGAKFERERLGEITGAVKLALATRGGLVIEDVVQPMTARKLMLGKNPPRDPKAVVRAFLLDRGMPREWTEDEVDAFVVANWKLALAGGPAFRMPAPVEAKRTRRRAA